MLKKIAIGVGRLIVLIVVIAAIAGCGGQKQTTTQSSPTVAQQAQFVFDVPSLVGKNLDEVKAALSSYQKKTLEPTEEQIKAGIKDWEMEFEKDGKSLLVTYEISTKKIKDFFISTDDISGKTKDKVHLSALGNLKEGDSRYRVEFVKAFADPAYFTGVKIIPAE